MSYILRALAVLLWATLALAGPASMAPSQIGTSSTTPTTVPETTTTTTPVSTTTTTTPTVSWPVIDDFQRPQLGTDWTAYLGYGTSELAGGAQAACPVGTTCMMAWRDSYTVDYTYACAQIVWSKGDTASLAGVCMGSPLARDLVCCLMNQGFVSMQASDNGAPLSEVVKASSAFSTGVFVGMVRTNATTFQCFSSTDGHTWSTRGTQQTIPNIQSNGRPGFGIVNENKMIEVWEGGVGALPATTHTCGTP